MMSLKIFRICLLFIELGAFTFFSANGQSKLRIEKVVIGDNQYILHNVQRKETLYSIARQYKCTQEEILKANRNIKSIIKKGMVLKIPDHSYKKPELVKKDESSFTSYRVVSGDNYYQLKLKFGLNEEELLFHNPALKDGLKAGMLLLIPKISQQASNQKELDNKEIDKKGIVKKEESTETSGRPINKDPISPGGFNSSASAENSYQIGLFLPFSISESDSVKINQKTLSILNFYQGSLMAIDRLTKEGLKVKLFVYDTENPNSKLKKLISNPEFPKFNLIIGPVYPETQREIATLCLEQRIPFVSPLSPDDQITSKNEFCYQVNPSKELRIKTTADYLVNEFPKENIIFLQQSNKSDTRTIYEMVLQRMNKEGIPQTYLKTYDLWSKGAEGLESMMEATRPNILVMADNNEVNVSVSMNRLNLLSKKYSLVLVGLQEFTKYQSIDTEQLHNINLRYIAPSHIDYGQLEIKLFIENFKTEFATEPSPFAFQGYDVTTYFLNLLQQNRETSKNSTDLNKNLLHASYDFRQISPTGGWMNEAFKVVEYAKTYDVKVLGTIISSTHP